MFTNGSAKKTVTFVEIDDDAQCKENLPIGKR